MKLHMNVPWVTLFQNYWFWSIAHRGHKGGNREVLKQTLKIFLSKTTLKWKSTRGPWGPESALLGEWAYKKLINIREIFLYSSRPGGFTQEDLLKISLFSPLWPLCAMDWNHLNKLERGSPKDHSCKVSSNSNQWFRRRCRLKVFSI